MKTAEELPTRGWVPLRDWALWQRPKSWIVFTLSTEAITLALTIGVFLTFSITASDLRMFGLLAGLALVHAEATRKVERLRRSLSVTPHINMTSVWMLPAALLLPMPLVAVLGALLYTHLGVRSWSKIQHVAAHRTVTNATTMVLSCYAAALAAHAIPGDRITAGTDVETASLAIFAAVVVHFVVALVITVIALYLAAPEKACAQRLLGSYDDNALELTTLCLGGLLALALVHLPLASVLMFFPMFVLQRSVLAKQLEELASTDQKTGLLNAVAWQSGGEREVSRSGRTGGGFGVLMIDLDFFKKINDTFGHMAGDDMLIAIADLLKRETRTHDLAGRFGGEEFVVLLAGASEREAVAAAERIRRSITELVVQSQTNEGEAVTIENRTASIGVAAYPANGATLDEVLAAADSAVYAAKSGGRNRVISAGGVSRGAPPLPARAAA